MECKTVFYGEEVEGEAGIGVSNSVRGCIMSWNNAVAALW